MLKESLGIGPSKCAPAHGSKIIPRTRLELVSLG